MAAESMEAPSAAAKPAMISLPPRSDAESIFRGGAGASPGPMTLVSSFFADNDHDSDCRSFSQLLAGAMASPTVVHQGGGGGGGRGQQSMFTVPVGLSPTTFFDSLAFISSVPVLASCALSLFLVSKMPLLETWALIGSIKKPTLDNWVVTF
ncbi:putative WRKY transcription factor 3 [Acorus calamus]|uniref:WRKY transcription factor 3 n=1 Tax=Acorus calamus TaxID=4465 RepID=A0AAV9EU21_ACOCL|nr:putative WRKY transcription factor 3 [Acorus calamus]